MQEAFLATLLYAYPHSYVVLHTNSHFSQNIIRSVATTVAHMGNLKDHHPKDDIDTDLAVEWDKNWQSGYFEVQLDGQRIPHICHIATHSGQRNLAKYRSQNGHPDTWMPSYLPPGEAIAGLSLANTSEVIAWHSASAATSSLASHVISECARSRLDRIEKDEASEDDIAKQSAPTRTPKKSKKDEGATISNVDQDSSNFDHLDVDFGKVLDDDRDYFVESDSESRLSNDEFIDENSGNDEFGNADDEREASDDEEDASHNGDEEDASHHNDEEDASHNDNEVDDMEIDSENLPNDEHEDSDEGIPRRKRKFQSTHSSSSDFSLTGRPLKKVKLIPKFPIVINAYANTGQRAKQSKDTVINTLTGLSLYGPNAPKSPNLPKSLTQGQIAHALGISDIDARTQYLQANDPDFVDRLSDGEYAALDAKSKTAITRKYNTYADRFRLPKPPRPKARK